MIRIDLHYNKQGNLWRFVLDGHADYAGHGQDIVCAAVSMIVINTINSIDTLTKEVILLSQGETGGYIDCTFPNIKAHKDSKEATLLLDSMVLGLQSIKNQYDGHIRINTKKHSSGGE